MSRPKKNKKSDYTLVKLGPRLDSVVQILGNLNSMSYASTVRMPVFRLEMVSVALPARAKALADSIVEK
jgi:hypothetical protein